ncbi:MAG: TIGR04206 family protein [Haloferacaceae archaeon]
MADPRRAVRRVDAPRPAALAALAALAVVPWSVQFLGGAVGLRFAWGMVTLDPPSASLLTAYLGFARSWLVFAWALAATASALAVALALAPSLTRGRLPRDDRLVAGLLALAGVANASVDWTFSMQPGRTALPVGTVALWALAWRWAHSSPDAP